MNTVKNSILKNFIWRFAERCGAQLVTFIVREFLRFQCMQILAWRMWIEFVRLYLVANIREESLYEEINDFRWFKICCTCD